MKKYIYLLLIISLVILSSCSLNVNDKDLINISPLQDDEYYKIISHNYARYNGEMHYKLNKETIDAYWNITSLLNTSLMDNENNVFSPVSLYSSLLMLYDGTDNHQILESLDILVNKEFSEDELKKVYYNFEDFSANNCACEIRSSLWFNRNFVPQSEYITQNHYKYWSGCLLADFNSEYAKERFNSWFAFNNLITNGDFINVAFDYDLVLLNEFYCKNEWLDKVSVFQKAFNNTSNEVNMVDYISINSDIKHAQIDKNGILYNVVYVPMLNGMKMIFVMPSTRNIEDAKLLKYDDFNQYMKDMHAIVQFPSFSVNRVNDFNHPFSNLNCSMLLNNDYEKIVGDKSLKVFIAQNAGFTVDAGGINASVYAKASVNKPINYSESIDGNIIINQPFMFYYCDVKDIPLYTGWISDL